jgi:nitrate reductase NapE component
VNGNKGEKKMTQRNNIEITYAEWQYIFISILFLALPVVSIISIGFSTWMIQLILLLLLALWFACVLYILLISTHVIRKHDREMELVKGIETYLTKVLVDVEWTDDTVNMVIDTLYDWTRLPEDEKYS